MSEILGSDAFEGIKEGTTCFDSTSVRCDVLCATIEALWEYIGGKCDADNCRNSVAGSGDTAPPNECEHCANTTRLRDAGGWLDGDGTITIIYLGMRMAPFRVEVIEDE